MTSRGLPRAAQLTGTVNKAMLLVDDGTQTKAERSAGGSGRKEWVGEGEGRVRQHDRVREELGGGRV